METLPIPAFYCCYLLRSTKFHPSLYVGSTPNLLRRIKQHNGQVKGGANRTNANRLRPWEVVCMVHGFPSKIAALQFEWSWQNTHVTRHIDEGERISFPVRKEKKKRTGETYIKVTRPTMPMRKRLENLNIMLRSRSFSRWPLSLRFFSSDVFQEWTKYAKQFPVIRSGIEIELDPLATPLLVKVKKKDIANQTDVPVAPAESVNPIEQLDFGYQSMKRYLEKSSAVLEAGVSTSCAVCKNNMIPEKSWMLVCPHRSCGAASHLQCLSKEFLRQGGQGGTGDAIVPLEGRCPSCHTSTNWKTLIQESSLRVRGKKEVEKLFKKPRRKKDDAMSVSEIVTAATEAAELDEAELEADDYEEDLSDFHDFEEEQLKEVNEEAANTRPAESASPKKRRKQSPMQQVNDSDWDDADVLD